MSMSRKDYVEIAEVIALAKFSLPDGDLDDLDGTWLNRIRSAVRADIVEMLVPVFRADNPNFDPARFKAAALR